MLLYDYKSQNAKKRNLLSLVVHYLNGCRGFVVRITRKDVLNRIYSQRSYFVDLRREWVKGLKLIFMKKNLDNDYQFIGSGTIEKIVRPEELNNAEKLLCSNSNCYRKIVFGQVARYYPGIDVRDIMGGALKPIALLHGMRLSPSDVSRIENLAAVSVIS